MRWRIRRRSICIARYRILPFERASPLRYGTCGCRLLGAAGARAMNPERNGNATEAIARALISFLPITSVVGVGLLICGAFTPQRTVLIGGLCGILIYRHLSPADGASRWPARAQVMLGMLLVFAFFIRWPPALYLEGGQDQGVYISMAAHFAETGSLGGTDELRAALQRPGAIERYDANNVRDGAYLPGVYADATNPGNFFFQFYPVHPLWMAMFGGLLGMEHAVLSQIFFALVSLFFAALLAERLTRNWRIGIVYAGALALLPLHVFFSKFPISEMPTLAFALMGWFAILCYHDSTPSRPRPSWLFAAASCFLALFCIRISGFVYLPVILVGALATHAFVDDPITRRQWARCWILIIAAYAASVCYGMIWAAPYARVTYRTGFGERIYAELPWLLPLAALLVMLPFVLTYRPGARLALRNGLAHVSELSQRWGVVVLGAIVLAGLCRMGLLAFTDHYQGNPWYDIRWNASHGGYDAFRSGSLWVAAAHLSPFAAILLPFAVWRPGYSGPRMLLLTMVLAMVAYTALLQWFTPYQYYYARYHFSEVVPYALLLVVVRAGDWWESAFGRRVLVAVAALCTAYFSWYSWPLIGFREASGAEESLARIANRLDSDDVLLLDDSAVTESPGIATPLRFFFHKHVYTVRDVTQIPEIVNDLASADFGDIDFIGAAEKLPVGFAFVDRVVFEETVMSRQVDIPRDPVTLKYQYSFYRFDANRSEANALVSPTGLPLGGLHPDCCTGVYSDGTWTNGNASLSDVPLPRGQWHTLAVRVHGFRPTYDDADLKVSVNGRQLPASGFKDNVFEFDLGTIEGPTTLNIGIVSRTFVPQQIGINDDRREIGIDVDSISIR
jgi:hypothetical protein